jgi:hypothetical protein
MRLPFPAFPSLALDPACPLTFIALSGAALFRVSLR